MAPSVSDPGDEQPADHSPADVPPPRRPVDRPEVPPPPPPRAPGGTGQTPSLRAEARPFAAADEAPAADGAGAESTEPVERRGLRHRRRLDTETPDTRPLRHRILPRSAIGISVVILFFAFGASLSGVILYSYYEYRLTQNEDRVSKLTNALPAEAKKANDALKAQQAEAQNLINAQLAPLRSVLATGQTVQTLAAKASPALYFVHTLDQAGQPSVGTAFAVASDSRQTLLLTSYTVVQAATRQPGPQVFVRHGSIDQALPVYNWDETKDLALLLLPTGNQPTLTFSSSAPQTGERVFALSGLGAQGASITQGFVADVSADGIQHDATTGLQFQGGPLLNSDGQAVGILSRTYAPLGFPVADVWFAVPPAAACSKVLSCPNGAVPSGGAGPGAAG